MNRKYFYHIQKNMFKNEMKLMKWKTDHRVESMHKE